MDRRLAKQNDSASSEPNTSSSIPQEIPLTEFQHIYFQNHKQSDIPQARDCETFPFNTDAVIGDVSDSSFSICCQPVMLLFTISA